MQQPTSLTRDDIVQGYRWILNRDPESESVINEKLQSHADWASLRATLLASDEYKNAQAAGGVDGFYAAVQTGYWAENHRIDYKVSPEMEARLTARIRDQWMKLGEEEPYWSVLTHEEFRTQFLNDEAIAQFRTTGRSSVDLIDLMARKGERTIGRGLCVELGCGVGRITRHLADRFDHVVAVDISAGNLEICRRYMAEEKVANVRTTLISDIGDLNALPAFDFFYSMIVLQHNSPPIQHRMLDILFARIRPGGSCLFQTVADMPGYGFEAESYLQSPSPAMEIHSLPMGAVLGLLQGHGFVIDSVRMDPWLNVYGSYTFLAHKPERKAARE